MRTKPEDIDAMIGVLRQCDEPSPSVGDWDRLLTMLQILHCDHQLVSMPAGGDPQEGSSAERVVVCQKCGYEPSGE